MTNEDIYDLFVAVAIHGLAREADSLLSAHKAKIYQVARKYSMKLPRRMTLYRGILLDLSNIEKADDNLVIKEHLPFEYISFTENPEVARWFASTDAYLSSYVVNQRPDVKGYVIKYEASPRDVIFHYSLLVNPIKTFNLKFVLTNFIANGFGGDLTQFFHNLNTQSEVILKPTNHKFELIPYDEFKEGGNLTGPQLDRKYLPSGF